MLQTEKVALTNFHMLTILKYPNHVTSYYVMPCVAVHVQWVKA